MKTSAPGQSALLLLDVIDIFNDKHIPYAIIGAFAASFYGVIRASLDADALISLAASREADDLCENLHRVGLEVEYRLGDREDPVAGVINIRDRFQNRVDLLTGIRGMSPDVFSRIREAEFMGAEVRIIGLEDFVAMKIFAGSPKDIQDAVGVLSVSGPEIDRVLLGALVERFGKECTRTLQDLLGNSALGSE